MSKRKLTKQQQRRIQAKQTKLTTDTSNHLDLLTGTVIAHHGPRVEIMTPNKAIVACKKRQNLGALVAGDLVWWQFVDVGQTEGIVEAIEHRKSILHKFSKQGEKTPLAANIDQMLIVISPSPEPSTTTIDRYLIAAKRDNIRPIIVLNKIDLLTSNSNLINLLNLYQSLGYQVEQLQAKRLNLTVMQQLLHNKTSIIVGQSGVGKSSLIKALLPNLAIPIGEIAKNIAQGKHTTTTARLYELPFGGYIIDSPGVRSFAVDNLTPQDLLYGFSEINQFVNLCKYKNCTHSATELGCAIQTAILANKITQLRFASYCAIRDTIRLQCE